MHHLNEVSSPPRLPEMKGPSQLCILNPQHSQQGEGAVGRGSGHSLGESLCTPKNPSKALLLSPGKLGLLLWDRGTHEQPGTAPASTGNSLNPEGSRWFGGRGCHTVPPALLLQDVPQDDLGPVGRARCEGGRGCSVPPPSPVTVPVTPVSWDRPLHPSPRASCPPLLPQDTTSQPSLHTGPHKSPQSHFQGDVFPPHSGSGSSPSSPGIPQPPAIHHH